MRGVVVVVVGVLARRVLRRWGRDLEEDLSKLEWSAWSSSVPGGDPPGWELLAGGHGTIVDIEEVPDEQEAQGQTQRP